MVGVTSIEVKENLDELTTQLRQASNSKIKEKLQVLYWLKQPQAPSISAIAQAMGKDRSTVHTRFIEVSRSPNQCDVGSEEIPRRGASNSSVGRKGFVQAITRPKSWV